MSCRIIAILAYDGMAALDLVGPLDAFHAANDHLSPGQLAYRTRVVGLSCRSVLAESGVRIVPAGVLAGTDDIDTLIVPGGAGLRNPRLNRRVAAILHAQSEGARRVATVCTGIYGLAPTGLLDGRRVATHWRFCADVQARYPSLRLVEDALFVRDGKFYTSAGISAGIDLALALIEEDHGPRVALAVARELVVYLKRPGGQSQYSEPLHFQTRSLGRMHGLASWIAGNLAGDLRIERLAEFACLSPRQFSRHFIRSFGRPAAAYVAELRLSVARDRLASRESSVASIAASVGFKSADAFTRAFRGRFGISPTDYRSGFSTALPQGAGPE